MSDNQCDTSPAFENSQGRSRPPRAGSIDDDGPTTERTFGCPYYKHDPSQHKWCMMRQTLTAVNYVKQHIRRHHQQPIHCPVCGDTFKTKITRDEHIKEGSCELREFTHEGLTQYELEALDRVSRRVTQSERWNQIWDILFPGEPRPDSPYVDDPVEEIGRLYLNGLNQRQRGSISTAAPKDDATTERYLSPEAFIPNTLFPGISNFSQLPEDVPGRKRTRQYATGQESGITTRPSHPKPAFIDSPQLIPQQLGDQQGHPPATDLEPWLSFEENHRESFYTEDTSHATAEPSAYAEFLPDTTPYHVDPSSDIGYPPDHGFLSPDLLESINDPIIGYPEHEYDGVPPSLIIPGSAMELIEDSGINWPPPSHLLKAEPEIHAAGPSEHGESSFHDSGFASHESRGKAREEEVNDNASIYSMDSISPESRDRYITALSNRLAEDICKLARNTTMPLGHGELLLEWMRTFALKLQGESSTMTKREASVFIRKHRRYVEDP